MRIIQILISITLLFSASANAYNIVYDGSGNVTAIGNLDIGDKLYNVDFESDVYSTFGGDEFFWVNSGVDLAVVSDAVNSALNTEAAYTTVIGNYYLVAESYDLGGGFGAFVYQNGVVGGDWQIGSGPVQDFNNPGRTAWTIAVPIPAAAWLFASSLAAIGFTRRKFASQPVWVSTHFVHRDTA